MRSSEESLRALMIRAQDGDKKSYAVLLEESGKWLSRFYAQKISADAVDDLVQDTLMSVHRKLASYDSSRAFLPWLAAIARYRWVDRLRQTYKHEAKALDFDVAEEGHEDIVGAKISIDRLLNLLPEGQAEVIQYVKIQGLSIAEAGAKTGQSESLVKVNIHRGLKKLAALIESE
ncbi:sigma-70 family RNA polymerase sigma factor [Sphingorhabdus arenilitoris]|uniref:Sigma-70 family RNA polymerase sigma factor n=1 Tax=Sphingorhabdus arenilitoris TaxID=1490041 RepID=A0ABV8RBN6_9SPHN